MHRSIKLVSTLEEVKLHHEEISEEITTKSLDEIAGCSCTATCTKPLGMCRWIFSHLAVLTRRNDVVHNDDLLARLDSITLYLKVVFAVLLLEALCERLSRELALLPYRYKSSSQPQRQSRPKQETSTLQAHNDINLALLAHAGVEGRGDLHLQCRDQAAM